MSNSPIPLDRICRERLLETKWLLAPSRRAGHQWIETLVRGGQPFVNLFPSVVTRLMLDLISAELAQQQRTYVTGSVASLLVDAAWDRLPADSYLGRLERSAELSARVHRSLMELRLAGLGARQLQGSRLESDLKAKDLAVLFETYKAILQSHALVDQADVLKRATALLSRDPQAVGRDVLVLIPEGLQLSHAERQFLDALPTAQRILISPPGMENIVPPRRDVHLLRGLAHPNDVENHAPHPSDGSVRFFRAIGEVNEIREVLRRCLAASIPLDDVEILHTDAETYVPLIYSVAARYFAEPDRPDGVPVTFAEGIPAGLSRPGRALVGWMQWIEEDFPQRLLAELFAEGLLDCGTNHPSFHYLARVLRPLAIGSGVQRYLPQVEEQIAGLRKTRSPHSGEGEEDDRASEPAARRLAALETIRTVVKRLVKLSGGLDDSPGDVLNAAEEFLTRAARKVNELDQFAADALVEQIQERRMWMERLGLQVDVRPWLAALPWQTRVLGSGPRPGRLHIAGIGSGGHSGRRHTFVVGLDDRRFPGAALQDPVLLDRERTNLSPHLTKSGELLRERIENLANTLSRLPGLVTLSWPCCDLADDREVFPSSSVLSAFRIITGERDADLARLNSAVGGPVSFAPDSPEKALDETERWLWRLSGEATYGADRTSIVQARYAHLARGAEARRERFGGGFGPFNGHVPEAGKDLDPTSDRAAPLSASALETAGRCPLAFFFRNALGLFPPDDAELDLDQWLDAAQFGSLLHEVFRRFLEDVASEGRLPEFERDHHRLADVLRAAVDQWRQEIPPPNESAFRAQYWKLLKIARIFLTEEEKFCRASRPRFFEVALGLERAAEGGPLDDGSAIVLRLADGKSIRVRGQIDRVDEVGEHRYGVWDYKTGSAYNYSTADPFRQGRRVQNVLYLQMAEAALRARHDPQAVVERFGYFFPGIRAHGLRVAWSAEELAHGMTILERLCSLVSAGAFIATDSHDDCAWCDYEPACRPAGAVTERSKELLQSELPILQTCRELRHG